MRENNGWQPSQRTCELAQPLMPVVDSAGWYSANLKGSREWMYQVSAEEIGEVFDAVAAVEARGLAVKDIRRSDFPLPRFAKVLLDIRAELMTGRGFALIRGIPVEERSRGQIATAFWGIGAYMGEARSQNAKGHVLGHVKDIGGDYSKGRGYMSRDALQFHTDRADILSLCCLHGAKSGGQHRIASSVTVYNEMLKRRPDLAKELTWRFYRGRNGEIPPEEKEWVREPTFSFEGGRLSTRAPSAPVLKAQQLPDVPKLTDAQKDAIDLFMDLALEFSLDIDFVPGDISFVMNHVVLHSRTEFEDWPESERRRHILRLWLANGERPLQEDVARAMRGVMVAGMVLEAPLEVA